jgi:hypothetical protein
MAAYSWNHALLPAGFDQAKECFAGSKHKVT